MQSAAASIDVAMISGELARSGHLKNVGQCGFGKRASLRARKTALERRSPHLSIPSSESS
eukprot:scaffold116298_cov27-Phaeocystis_antarctica.AAC.1